MMGVIADDFTGAMDAGVQVVAAGLETVFLLSPRTVSPGHVPVVSTDSRNACRAAAQASVANAARLVRGRAIFKKIDSTMRGHTAAEIEAILQVTGQRKAVVCPAAIELGRTVRDGRLRVNDVLLHESSFARDPVWPATTSNVEQLLGGATRVPLHTVRAGRDILRQAIARAPGPIVAPDAMTKADLARISRAILDGGYLACGALGLAAAWVRALVGARPDRRANLPAVAGPVLIVAGSRHPQSHLQIGRLAATDPGVVDVVAHPSMAADGARTALVDALAAGRAVILRSPAEALSHIEERQAVERLMADLVREVVAPGAVGAVVLTGGDTAAAACRALEAQGVQILGECEPGVPWGRLLGGPAEAMPVVTKAGGFGARDCLVRIVDRLRPSISRTGPGESSHDRHE